MWNLTPEGIGDILSSLAVLLGVVASLVAGLKGYTREAMVTHSIKRYAETLAVLPQGTSASQDFQKILDIKAERELEIITRKNSRKFILSNLFGLLLVESLLIALVVGCVFLAIQDVPFWAGVLLFVLAGVFIGQAIYLLISYLGGNVWKISEDFNEIKVILINRLR